MDLKTEGSLRITLGVVLAALLCAAPLHAQESGIAVGRQAPGAKLETLDGTVADLGQFIGKGPLVISFWATW